MYDMVAESSRRKKFKVPRSRLILSKDAKARSFLVKEEYPNL